MWGVAGRDSTGNRGQLVRRVMSFSGFRAGLFRVLRGPFFRPAGGWFVFPLSPTACEAGEKCDSELHHRAPAAEAGPIFHRVTVCLKAYPDTNREYSGIRIESSWIRIESFPGYESRVFLQVVKHCACQNLDSSRQLQGRPILSWHLLGRRSAGFWLWGVWLGGF